MMHRIQSVSELGLLVRATRKAENLRLDDTAGCAKVGHVFLRELEHGKPTVQLAKVLQVLDELGIRLYAEAGSNITPILDQLQQQGLRPLTPRKNSK